MKTVCYLTFVGIVTMDASEVFNTTTWKFQMHLEFEMPIDKKRIKISIVPHITTHESTTADVQRKTFGT